LATGIRPVQFTGNQGTVHRRSATGVRQPLGQMQSRKLASAQHPESLPNAPAGKYVVIKDQTAFENMPSATETIVPMLDKDAQWCVSGYVGKQ
jgi:hypothetical protein